MNKPTIPLIVLVKALIGVAMVALLAYAWKADSQAKAKQMNTVILNQHAIFQVLTNRLPQAKVVKPNPQPVKPEELKSEPAKQEEAK